MRGIMAIALAGLLSFTAPVYAAELEVPPLVTKEAPPLPPVVPVAEFDWVPLAVVQSSLLELSCAYWSVPVITMRRRFQ